MTIRLLIGAMIRTWQVVTGRRESRLCHKRLIQIDHLLPMFHSICLLLSLNPHTLTVIPHIVIEMVSHPVLPLMYPQIIIIPNPLFQLENRLHHVLRLLLSFTLPITIPNPHFLPKNRSLRFLIQRPATIPNPLFLPKNHTIHSLIIALSSIFA